MLTNIFIIIAITFNTLFILSVCKLTTKCDAWEEELINDVKEKSYIV